MALEVSPDYSGSIKLNNKTFESYPASYNIYGRINANLEAVPAPGYRFSNWSGDLEGTENPASLYITYDSVITANFSPIVHTVTLAVKGNGITKPEVGPHMYNYGEVVDITAMPDYGWQFDSWSGDVDKPQSAETEFTVNSNGTVTANFSPLTHAITLEVKGQGSTIPAMGAHQYDDGEVIDITAIPDEHWQFYAWNGYVTDSQSATTTIIANSNKTVTAIFSPIMHSVSLKAEGNGSIQPAAGSYEYNEAEIINITAVADEGWQFDSWSGDVANPQSIATTIVIDSDKTVTANFSKIEWWHVLRIIYGELMAMFMSLGN